jgi:transcriptional regulator with XRE-family HTH domain
VGSTLQLIGQRLKEARQTVGYTPEEVSQKLGISKDELFLFESGRKSPPLSLLRKFAKLYGVFDSYFYGIDKPEGEVFALLLYKAKELSLSPETISQLHRFTFLCREIVQLRQRLGIPKPEIPRHLNSQANLGELLELSPLCSNSLSSLEGQGGGSLKPFPQAFLWSLSLLA